jgi:hypothetical protein
VFYFLGRTASVFELVLAHCQIRQMSNASLSSTKARQAGCIGFGQFTASHFIFGVHIDAAWYIPMNFSTNI